MNPAFASLIGLLVAGIGLLGVVAPTRLRRILDEYRMLTELPVTLAVRIITGSIFLISAADCRVPALIRTVGILEFGGAIALLGLGGERLGRFAEWWLGKSPFFVRYWCLGAFAFGAVIVYASA